MLNIIKTKEELDLQIQSSNLLLVDFFATWCGPCKMLSPVLESFFEKHKQEINVVKVDIDQSNALAYSYNIQAVPTMLLFKQGKLIKTLMGYQNLSQLEKLLS